MNFLPPFNVAALHPRTSAHAHNASRVSIVVVINFDAFTGQGIDNIHGLSLSEHSDRAGVVSAADGQGDVGGAAVVEHLGNFFHALV